MYWHRKQAEQGSVQAQFDLGKKYFSGSGVPQDYAKAVYWFRTAAEQGDATVQAHLGTLYQRGEGVAQNYVHAYAWYSLAAAQGWGELLGADLAKLMTKEQIAEAQKLAPTLLKTAEHNSQPPKSTKPAKPRSGTGFVVTELGHLVTNAHVVANCTSVQVMAIPVVLGISATVERFNTAMAEAEGRATLPNVVVDSAKVQESGLLKDTIILDIPNDVGQFDTVLLRRATDKIKESNAAWVEYAKQQDNADIVNRRRAME
jgi:S1-C subfamily serine protease